VAVVVVGVHERDVPLDVLERVAVSDLDLGKALKSLCDSPHLAEAVVLSTCLRTEVYAVVERFHDGVADIEAFFESRAGLRWSAGVAGPDGSTVPPREGTTPGAAAGGLYCLFDDAAAAHLFEVAAGLDSAVLGEGEVLRQVRHAHERARAEHTAGPVLGRLFRHAVEIGKRARSETDIARGVTSLSHAAVALAAEELGGSLEGRRVLVVGAGEMGSGMVTALERMSAPPELVVANRSRARAQEIARRLDGEVVDLDNVSRVLAGCDVLLTCTAAPSVLFEPADVAPLMGERPERPLLVVDAALPRDVDPAVGALEGVTLRDMDDLRAFAERQMAGRLAEVERVRAVLAREMERYRADSAARNAVPVISSLRTLGESVRNEELARHAGRLGTLDEEQRAAVEALTRGIVAKLLHEPTVRLKDAAGSPRGERLGEALRALFDL
jgi:glutamyl-tRNA reductase